jgi:surfeit locus 1 family protein
MICFRPLPLMTLFSLPALAALIWLGAWQWEKYETKTAAAIAPTPEMTIADYQPVLDGVQFVFGVRGDTHEQGWRVFAPVQDGEQAVFVDAGFIPGRDAPDPRSLRYPAALRESDPVTGASIRPQQAGPLALAPQPMQRLWFSVDLAAMGRNAGLERVADFYLAAAYVGEDGRASANPFALGPGADALPPARHMGYALTWYGLAAALIVIYFAYHRSVGRLSLQRPRRPEA